MKGIVQALNQAKQFWHGYTARCFHPSDPTIAVAWIELRSPIFMHLARLISQQKYAFVVDERIGTTGLPTTQWSPWLAKVLPWNAGLAGKAIFAASPLPKVKLVSCFHLLFSSLGMMTSIDCGKIKLRSNLRLGGSIHNTNIAIEPKWLAIK